MKQTELAEVFELPGDENPLRSMRPQKETISSKHRAPYSRCSTLFVFSRVFLAVSSFALVRFSIAQGQESRFYLKADLGGSLVEDSQANTTYDYNPFLNLPKQNMRFKARFEPGRRAGIGCGYQIRDWCATEGEIGAVINDVNGTGLRDATFANVPFLFNLKLRYPNHSNWIPYAGAGLGIAASILDGDVLIQGNTFNAFQRLSTTEADAVFAYQAFAGVRYKLNDRIGLSLEYRFLVTEGPQWDIERTQLFQSKLAFGRIETHALSLAFDYRF